MPREVEIKLVLNADKYTEGIRNAIKENKKLDETVQKGSKQRLGLIEAEARRVDILTEKRKKARSIEEIKLYNRLLEDAKTRLQGLESASDSIGKKTSSSFLASMKALVGLTTAMTAFKKVMESTKSTSELLKREISAVKGVIDELARSIASGNFEQLGKRLSNAARSAREYTDRMEDLENLTRSLQMREAERAVQLEKLRILWRNESLDYVKRKEAAEEYIRIVKEGEEDALKVARERYDAIIKRAMVASRLTKEEIEQKLREGVVSEQAVEDARAYLALLAEMDKEKNKYKTEVSPEGVIYKVFVGGDPEKIDELQKKIDAVPQSVKNMSKELKGWDLVTDEMRQSITDAYVQIMDIQAKAISSTIRANNLIGKELFSIPKLLGTDFMGLPEEELEYFIKRLFEIRQEVIKFNEDLMKDATDILIKSGDNAKKYNEVILKENKINDNQLRDERLKALKESLREISDVVSQIINKELELAQREREIYDQRILEAQNALDAEISLYQAGYASNVAAKQKEIEELKKLREQALRDEEAAMKRQMAMEKIQQGVNIFTSATQLLKSYTKLGPLGLPLAAAAIALMFTLLTSVKKRSSETIKLAEGGHGEIKGRTHSQGGEPFLSHVEVEAGERWGVLNRAANRRYGRIFDRMVDAFNRHEIESIDPVNNILVENTGPNKRLDEVNKNLKSIKGKENILNLSDRIIIQKGCTTKVIKKR